MSGKRGAMTELTYDRLLRLLSYDSATGVFASLVNRGPIKIGDLVGGINAQGYVQIQIDGIIYYGHRLAWLYMTGEWPKDTIDHINGVRNDNRFDNLRDVDAGGNNQNQRRPRIDNKTGMLGVSKHSQMDKWVARIKIGDTYQHLGCFDTPEEAHAAYLAAKRQHHSTCTI
jgi:hypothetical protein